MDDPATVRVALKSRGPIGIRWDRRRQDLGCDLTQPGVGRPIHLAHAAFANLGRDFVDAEADAGDESQTGGSIAVSVARTRSLPCDVVVFRARFKTLSSSL